MSDLMPDQWERRSLSSLGQYENGFAFNEAHWSEQGLPIIRIAQITGSQGIVDRYPGRLPDTFRIDDGNLIFSWSGTLAVVRWTGGPAWLNQHLFKVVPVAGVDDSLLFHVLQASVAEMNKRTHGSTMKHIKRSELREFFVSLPKAGEEQGKLAQVLDTLDTAIRETEAIIAKLKAVKQGLLHDLLTRGIDDNGELRPPRTAAPHLYRESPLGWIPKTWDTSPLSELGRDGLINGVFKEPKRVGSGIPLVNVADLYRGESVGLAECERFDATDSERSRYSAMLGDIFFTRSSLKLEGIAQSSFLAVETDSAVFECHVMRLRPNTEKVVPRFLKQWCVGIHARKHFMANAKQVTMTTISQDGIACLTCPTPPLSEQIEAVRQMEATDSRLKSEGLTVEKLRAMKRALMDDLLTGRVRVTPLLGPAAA